MSQTIVHLLRHGEVHNPTGVLYGRMPDFHLSALGGQMAQAAADYLQNAGANITYIAASPLERAQETAAPAAAAFNLPIHAEAALIEAGSQFEGLDISRRPAQLAHPRHWAALRNPWRPSGGESYVDIAQRVEQAVRRARIEAQGSEALLVSHQLPIWAFRLLLERRPLAHLPMSRQCALASLTSVIFEDSRLVGLAYREPAFRLAARSRDINPGQSAAATV